MAVAVRVELDEQGIAEVIAAFEREVDVVRERVADWARRLCPVDTGRLRASIRVDGEDVVCGGPGADYWPTVEFGSVPHIIRSHGPWPLRNRRTGQVFGRMVHHPGTPEQPFMRAAFYVEVGS
jgi:hypothetical protein